MNRRVALASTLALALGACASMRKVDVGSEPSNTVSSSYNVDVYNSHSSTLTVSYTDSRGTHELGTVASERTQRFIIASPASTTVTIMGMTSGGGHYTAQRTLVAGGTTSVTL